jgi:hypothetical protein
MSQERQRPAGGPGAEGTVFGENSKSKFDYTTSACTCHERRPCRVCSAWFEHYKHTRAAVRVLDAIAPAPRPALRLVKGERRP